MALTADQLNDFYGDLSIAHDETVFTDAQLNRFYTRAGEDYETAVYLAWRQLSADATKFVDYRVGETQESKEQIYKHIRDMLNMWADLSGASADSVTISTGYVVRADE